MYVNINIYFNFQNCENTPITFHNSCISTHKYICIKPQGNYVNKNGIISKRIIQNDSVASRYGIALMWMPTRINDKVSGSGNGLVLPGNKLLPKPMLMTHINVAIWSQHATMS